MELKKREVIQNVNFNSKGEKIKNAAFDDEKKGPKTKLGKVAEVTAKGLMAKKQEKSILAPPGENEQKEVAVSNAPDSSIAIANGSPLEDHEKNVKRTKFKKLMLIGGILGLIVLLVGGYFGLEARDIYLKEVPLEQVLKGDAQVVIELNSNAEFEQYKYLDDNLRKFPGYRLLEKELDDVGEGKTMSQAFQDQLTAHNLSFDEDIVPVIGDRTLVVIPTVTPLTNELQRLAFDTGRKAQNALRKRELEGKVAENMTEAGKVKVLGLTSDFYLEETGKPQQDPPEPVDFIMGAAVKSLKNAKKVLDKIKSDTSKYEVSEVKFEGYSYYKITRRAENGDDDFPELLSSVKDTCHALIGRNWVMTTKESDLKEMIAARKAQHTLVKLSFWKKAKEKISTLANDADYKVIKDNLAVKAQEGLASIYLKIDYNSLVTGPETDLENQPEKFFKSHEQGLLLGALLRVTPEGIVIRSASNQINLKGFTNTPIATGLIQKMPQRVANRWTDGYSETAAIKDAYYNLKRNNLTQAGIEMLNEAREELKKISGIDFEADFIDHFSGDIALAAFTANGLSPQGSLIVEVDNKEAMLASLRKVVEAIKKTQLSYYQFMLNPYPMSSPAYSLEDDFDGQQDPSVFEEEAIDPINPVPGSYVMPPEFKKELNETYQAKVKAIQESQLVELQTEIGPVYTYQIAGVPEVSLNCAFSEGRMVLATSQEVAVDLIKELGVGNATKLIQADDFKRVTSNLYPEGYAKSFITPLGIWNGINYYIDKMELNLSGANMLNATEEKDRHMQQAAAISTIFKTLSSVSAIETAAAINEEKTLGKAAVYIDIKEVSKEEKEYAERILEKY